MNQLLYVNHCNYTMNSARVIPLLKLFIKKSVIVMNIIFGFSEKKSAIVMNQLLYRLYVNHCNYTMVNSAHVIPPLKLTKTIKKIRDCDDFIPK